MQLPVCTILKARDASSFFSRATERAQVESSASSAHGLEERGEVEVGGGQGRALDGEAVGLERLPHRRLRVQVGPGRLGRAREQAPDLLQDHVLEGLAIGAARTRKKRKKEKEEGGNGGE